MLEELLRIVAPKNTYVYAPVGAWSWRGHLIN